MAGRFGFSGPQDLNLNVERLPLDTLAAFMTQPPKMSGLLAVKARIAGTAAAPEISASARLSDASFAGQAYAGAVADVGYQSRKASLRLSVQQDATHSLNGAGTLPLNLSWHDGWRADFADGMELRLQSAGVSLAFLNAFSGKAVENIAGTEPRYFCACSVSNPICAAPFGCATANSKRSDRVESGRSPRRAIWFNT